LRNALREDGALASLVRPGLLVTRWLGRATKEEKLKAES
jgi:hypothetical protein